jgi:hypothetical protein
MFFFFFAVGRWSEEREASAVNRKRQVEGGLRYERAGLTVPDILVVRVTCYWGFGSLSGRWKAPKKFLKHRLPKLRTNPILQTGKQKSHVKLYFISEIYHCLIYNN